MYKLFNNILFIKWVHHDVSGFYCNSKSIEVTKVCPYPFHGPF